MARSLLYALCAGAFAVLAAWPSAADVFSFRRLGEEPGGTYFDVPNDLSPDGTIVVGCCWATAPYPADSQALYWSEATGIVPLGTPPGGAWSSTATGLSADGSTIVGYFTPSASDTNHVEIFRWTPATGMVSLGDLSGGPVQGGANAVTSDGVTMVGTGATAAGARAFRRSTGGSFEILPPTTLPAWSGANDVSDDGTIAVGWAGSSGSDVATRWDAAGTPQSLGLLPGATSSYAESISRDGTTIVGSSGVDGAWLFGVAWENGQMRPLAHLATGFYGGARDTNADGTIIVGSEAIGDPAQSEWDYRATLWDPAHGTRDLNSIVVKFGVVLDGWQLVTANAVSADGRTIVGTLQRGFGPGAQREFQAYWLHLPVECADGIDDDGDGLIDFGSDPQCTSSADDLERPARACGAGGAELLAIGAGIALRRRALRRGRH